jgi:hypothetical protein
MMRHLMHEGRRLRGRLSRPAQRQVDRPLRHAVDRDNRPAIWLRRAATGPEFGIQQARIAKFGDPLLADELDPWVIVNRRQIEPETLETRMYPSVHFLGGNLVTVEGMSVAMKAHQYHEGSPCSP